MPGIKTYFARVAKSSTTPRRDLSYIHDVNYSTTPTTTRTTTRTSLAPTTGTKLRSNTTPKTTRNLQSPATSGKTRHYTKPTLIYRPLELDTESSSESIDDLLRHRNNSVRGIEPSPLCLPASKSNGSQQKQKQPPTPMRPAAVIPPNPPKKQPYPENDGDDDIQIIQVIIKQGDSIKTPNSTKRRKTHHHHQNQEHNHHSDHHNHDNISSSEKSAQKVTDKKPIEIVQASQCMTPPITPEKGTKEMEERVEKEMGPTVKMPTFIPGNCNIEEIMRLYGAGRNQNPDANKILKKSEAV